MNTETIVFFDGVCNLCNSAVDFIIQRDQRAYFKFAALQSDAAMQVLPADVQALDTIVLWENDTAYVYSEAALRIGAKLFPLGSLLLAFLLVPKFIRDGVYRWVAKNRYRWFGKTNSCRLPTPEEQARFI